MNKYLDTFYIATVGKRKTNERQDALCPYWLVCDNPPVTHIHMVLPGSNEYIVSMLRRINKPSVVSIEN